jgi:hypothetical protein
MSEELAQAMNQQLQMFRQKFGRDPGPEDPIFFDPDADTPVPMPIEKMGAGWNEVLQKAGELGMDPAIIYAMRKTGAWLRSRICSILSRKSSRSGRMPSWNTTVW